jgi:hypothetical protein
LLVSFAASASPEILLAISSDLEGAFGCVHPDAFGRVRLFLHGCGNPGSDFVDRANHFSDLCNSRHDCPRRCTGRRIGKRNHGEAGESGVQIGKVTRLINSIAKQTNLLALNATLASAANQSAKAATGVAGTGCFQRCQFHLRSSPET